MYNIGVDIGSTASKLVVMNEDQSQIIEKRMLPSGWNMKETSQEIKHWLAEHNYLDQAKVVATGYGRISVPFADKRVTEITCHARGAQFLSGDTLNIIDIGGQDTKLILMKNGIISDFLMNDKCAAGTGRFVEVMANRLGLTLQEMFEAARRGSREITLSSLCTVFAESEVITLMGKGTHKDDLAAAIINSITRKVSSLVMRKQSSGSYFLTGGFAGNELIVELLAEQLGTDVQTSVDGRYAGAIGAAREA